MKERSDYPAETGSGIVSENFCRIEVNLRLRQKTELCEIIFVELDLDFQFFGREEQRGAEIST